MSNWAVIGPLIGVVLAPILSYLVATRKQSGKVATTEAATLWAEAEKMREVYRVEADRLRKEVSGLRTEVVALRKETVALREETVLLREDNVRLREEAGRFEAELLALRAARRRK